MCYEVSVCNWGQESGGILSNKSQIHLLLSASVDRHSFCITGFSLSFPSTVANVLNDGCNRSWRFFTSLDSGAQITIAKRFRSKLTVVLEKLSFLCGARSLALFLLLLFYLEAQFFLKFKQFCKGRLPRVRNRFSRYTYATNKPCKDSFL